MSAGADRRLVFRPRRVAIAAGAAALVVIAILLIVLIGPSNEEQITDVTLAYGQAEGADACQYLSAEAFERLGGQEGCEFHFQGVGSVDYEVQSIEVEGGTATARVLNTDPQGQAINLGYVEEDGEWRISSFPGLEDIVPADQPVPTTAPEETETAETETDSTTAPEETEP
jgi:hypothetical protein